jgi:hypothetical protein
MATIASLLAEHVRLRVRSVDRIFLHGYVPRLQTQGLVVRFLLDQGFPIPSPALLGKIGRRYVDAVDRYARNRGIPVVRFKRDDCKEDVARNYFTAAERDGRTGVVMLGVGQEKTQVWRGWRHGGSDEHPHFEFGRQSAMVNHYYWYILDPEWGPSFVKSCGYAPFGVWVYLNGHEWAKRQAARQAIAFTPLDNGFASCEDPMALQTICDRLGATEVHEFFERWLGRLPSPLTAADRARGYGHALAFRQIEISDTHAFDRPAAGRGWFERTLPDQLCLGRPDEVSLVFDRKITRRTPGRFLTRVLARGVEPAIQIRYKRSKLKQYFKEGRALRTETTINNTKDFGVGRSVTDTNFKALVQIGHKTNERLLHHQLQACQCAPDATTLGRVVLPSIEDGLPAPGLRFGEPRTMTLLACVCSYRHLIEGLTNRTLRELIAAIIPGYSARQMTYDLRRLRRKGLIRRIPKSQRYELTDHGRRIAVFLTKTYTRILNPSLTELEPALPDEIANRSPIARAWRAFEQALDARIADAAITA